MKKVTLALLLMTSASISYAKEKKVQHDAHEHGVAEMNVIWEKDELKIELESPAFNITGFEHQPSNHEQEEVIEKIEKELNSPDELFAFKDASCKADHIKIESPFEDDHGHEEHGKHKDKDKHDEHDHAKHEEHDEHDDDHKEHKSDEKHADHDDHKKHDKHDNDHDEDHKEHAKHDKHDDHDDHKDHKSEDKHDDHDDHADESTHSEYSISYEFKCEGTKSELTIETAELFKHLPQMEKIKVQWLSATTQSSSILTKESNTLTLK